MDAESLESGNLVTEVMRIETPVGEMTAAASDTGISFMLFSDSKTAVPGHALKAMTARSIMTQNENIHLLTLKEQMEEYFEGIRKSFSVPLIFSGTEFQIKVWKELQRIQYGFTISYKEQAFTLNSPESVRAVANANGMNRLAILIPCHRVIGSNGRLTGYGGGLARKKWLLEHERKHSGKPVSLSLFDVKDINRVSGKHL